MKSLATVLLAILCSALVLPLSLAQEVTFSDEILITGHTLEAHSVFSADLDGDGDYDVLSASLWDNKIAWYENTDGLGSFGTQQIITISANGAYSVFSADLDGDGDYDVLSASYWDDKIAWYENLDGLGSFGPQQIITTSAFGASSVFSADLDGDGDYDVLSASFDNWEADDKIAWYENTDGLGSFGPQQIITTNADNARSVFSADLDGDGDYDVLSASATDDKIAWYENTDGLGCFGPQQIITTSADYATSVFSADLDGDGDYDVLSASEIDDKIAWYENTDGLGSFGPQQIITTSAAWAWSVFSADLDGDGDCDVLSASSDYLEDDNKIAWYENTDGLGSFGPQQIITTSADGACSVFSADLDGDGDYDVLSASWEDDKIAWCENTNGLGSFGPQQIITTSANRAFSVFSADLDGDGDYDVLSASQEDDKIAWYENTDGFGTFSPQQIITTSAAWAWSVFSADLDGDGDCDVLSASYEDDKIAWYENTDGLGSFGPQQIITTSADGAGSVFSADLDGDGDYDVLSASHDDDKIAWYENTDGLGSFGPQQIITTSTNHAWSVFSADLDGDEDYDVLSASLYDDKIAWYENTDGLGNFGPQQIITTSSAWAYSVFSADLDGDEDYDVLSASRDDNKIAWYENTDGLGSFGPQQIITTSADYATSVFSADLDRDGDYDVLSASVDDDMIAWYENTDGLGSFGPQQIITTSANGAVSVFCTDLDGDNDMDVLSASYGDDKIAWYRNETDFGQPPLPFGLLAPDSGSVVATAEVLLEWEATTDPNDDFYTYWIHVLDDLEQLENNEIVGTTLTSWTFTGESGIQYWWSILARDNRGNETWADQVYSFTIALDAVEETENHELPARYEITSIYPNPFNAEVSITVGLPEPSELELQVINILGQTVGDLADGEYHAGYHNFTFDGSDMSSGIYFVQATVPGRLNEIRKVVLMK